MTSPVDESEYSLQWRQWNLFLGGEEREKAKWKGLGSASVRVRNLAGKKVLKFCMQICSLY